MKDLIENKVKEELLIQDVKILRNKINFLFYLLRYLNHLYHKLATLWFHTNIQKYLYEAELKQLISPILFYEIYLFDSLKKKPP